MQQFKHIPSITLRMAGGLTYQNPTQFIVNIVNIISDIEKRSTGLGLTRSLRFDDGLRWNAHATFVERQLAAGQAVGPTVIVTDHHRLAAWLGPLAHGLARFNGLMLKVNCADGSIHGAEEEEQIWTAAGTWTSREKVCYLNHHYNSVLIKDLNSNELMRWIHSNLALIKGQNMIWLWK